MSIAMRFSHRMFSKDFLSSREVARELERERLMHVRLFNVITWAVKHT